LQRNTNAKATCKPLSYIYIHTLQTSAVDPPLKIRSLAGLCTLKRSISLNGLDGGECLHSATPRQPTGFLILLAGLCTLKRSINLNGFEGGECLHSKATRQPTRSLHPFSVIPFPGHVLRFRLAVGRVRNLAPQWLFMSHSYLITNLSSPLSVNTYAPPQL